MNFGLSRASSGPVFIVLWTCASLYAQNLTLNIPAAAGYDNTVIMSSVDGSGNPNFLGTASSTSLPINGANMCGTPSQLCPLTMMIAGQYQVLNTNITVTLPTTAGEYFIYAMQDLANANLVAGDFGSTNIAPIYQYTAPTCSASAAATNPDIWFDLSTNVMKFCTSPSGSFSAAQPPAIVIGVADVNGSAHVDQALCEPYRLNPYRRVELFGTGVDATITSGTTVDGWKQLSVLYLSGSSQTLTHSGWTSTTPTPGLIVFSQNAIMILNGALVNADGKGRVGIAGGSGTGQAGLMGGCAGAGGGGGGSTANSGGAGGNRISWLVPGQGIGGGSAGASGTPTAGGNGQNETVDNNPDLREVVTIACLGASGGAGAGDGANAGGGGGAGGGVIILRAPSILVDGTPSIIEANGNAGSNASATGNAAGGGGGAGGTALLQGIFVNQNGTLAASGGAGGNGNGSGKGGGSGGTGLAQSVKLQ